jgi:translation initiation factor 2B subunit (eIF-2B alpha/beta/delta family)
LCLFLADVKPLLLAALRPGESVLTAGSDPLVSAALEKCAAREPPLRVFWAEGGPGAPGRAAAATFLAAAPTATVVVIPDACAAAVLAAGAARRVVLPAAAVARDGSAVAPAGALPLALAARAAGAALLLLAPAYALSPATSAGRLLACGPRLQGDRPVEIFAAGAAGAAAVGACGFRALDAPRAQPVDVVNPLFDAVPAHLVSLLLTNRGGAGGSSGIARLGERAFGRAP